MINTLLGKVFGTKNEREIKRLMPHVSRPSRRSNRRCRSADGRAAARQNRRVPQAHIRSASASIADEPDADPDRRKQIEDERTKVLKEVLDEILEPKPSPWSAKPAGAS